MTSIGHVMILASAGSGKTYALTNRFVRLLALGAKPERIVALTFTRKAAGEFFDEILNKLARAAREPEFAQRLGREIEVPDGEARAAGQPELGPADFLKMLRTVADAMHRLRLGTFDGFFARVARNFPLELGLAGDFELLQPHAAQMERGRVLRRMFERVGELAEAQREFIEAFKRATFGADEKRLGAQLDRFIDEHQEIFLAAPDRELWGHADKIWPEGCEWLEVVTHPEEAVKRLRAWIDAADIGDKQRVRWNEFIEVLTAWSPGVTPPRAMAYVLEKALGAWEELKAGSAVLEFDRKKQELGVAAGAALAELTRHVVGRELARRMEITQGIHAVLRGYEAVYHDAVRRAGKLTFGDVQRLLRPGRDGARMLSREASDEQRLLIDFRLDAEIDHWLLDEFQDTSFGQWSVLKNLIDEAVQDPTGGRSFFYVGDVKQAIFAWRDGDPRLFREIFNHYNFAQPGRIAERHLVESYRSGPAVIELVNRVFGDAAVMVELFPGVASEAWNKEWLDHKSAKPELGGHAALLHAEDETARFATALALLHAIEPLERGLTCVLLVQKNDTASRLAEYLRREGGVPAVAESDLRIATDNPIGAVLLALLQAAAHPGDTLARGHLNMTPLGAVLAAEEAAVPEELTRRVLGQIHAEGFERTLDAWWQKLEPRLSPDDRFSRERAAQFIGAARQFDATGSRAVAEFIQFMERHAVRESDPAAVVRVMTVHKAKGLGFDLVILPDLEGTKLDGRRDGLAVRRADDRTVEWITELPGKLFIEPDATLSAQVRADEAAACYENLSLLYVAMTRAKRAMYLITKSPGKSASRNFPRLLAETLGDENTDVRVGPKTFAGALAVGDADWHLKLALPPTPALVPRELVRLDVARVRKSQRLPARRPSDDRAGIVDAARLFAGEADRVTAVEFGREVHALLATVEWVDEAEIARFRLAWAGHGLAGELALACISAPQLADIWKRRAGAKVWRERAFEFIDEGTWVTGVFDRVVVDCDEAGRALGACVYDFKTDTAEAGAAERYAAQLNLYSRAIALLTNLGRDTVRGEIVLVRSQRSFAVTTAKA